MEALDEWYGVVCDTFHGGSDTDLADLSCFGVFRTFSKLPFFDEIIQETKLKDWYFATKQMVGEHSCISHI